MLGRSTLAGVALAAMLGSTAWAQPSTLSEDRAGHVSGVDVGQHVVVLDDGRMYRVTPGTEILVNGRPVALQTVQPGTTVVIHSGQPVVDQNGQYVVAAPPAATAPAPVVVGPPPPIVVNPPAASVATTPGTTTVITPGGSTVTTTTTPGAYVAPEPRNPLVYRDGRDAVLNQGYRDAGNGGSVTWDSKYAGWEADTGNAGMQVQAGS
jgi:hypothetical protein